MKEAGDLLNTPQLVREYLQRLHGEDVQEQTGALFLNARNRLIRHDADNYRGTLDRAVVEPREILRRALLCSAAGIILHHNHPSGDPSLSREDREFTRRLATAAESVGIRLLDHLVVSARGASRFERWGCCERVPGSRWYLWFKATFHGWLSLTCRSSDCPIVMGDLVHGLRHVLLGHIAQAASADGEGS